MGGVQIQNAMLADSPALLWACQEASGNLQDASGNSRPTTNSINSDVFAYRDGGLGAGPGGDDYCFGINNGIYSEAEIYRSSYPISATNNLSLAVWYKPASTGYGDTRPHFSTGGGYSIRQHSSKFNVTVEGLAHLSDSSSSLSTSAWNYLVALRDAGTWKYYFNGSLDTSNAGSTAPNAPSGSLQFGYNISAGTHVRIAYLAVYNSVLSATRIAAHYAAATASGFVPQTVMLAEADEPDRRRIWTPRGIRLPRPRIIVPELA